jgi:hypothetical protein
LTVSKNKNMEGMAEMATLRSFTDNEKMLMKKALYYDFMLFNRNQKPFNAFLVKRGLKNTIYTPQKNVSGSTDPHSSMRGINRYDVGLHMDLSSPNHFNPIDNENLAFILESFKNHQFGQSQIIFDPSTSEQIDQGIKAIVANLTPGAPLYNCSTDAVMSAIMAGRFDEFLSDQNKEDMMRICYSGADPVIEGEEEEIELPQRMRPTATATGTGASAADFGGKKKRNKSKSKKRSNKSKSKKRSKSRSKKRSKKRSNGRSKKGGAPASYVGSIQGEFINDRGQQLFRNPVGGIA